MDKFLGKLDEQKDEKLIFAWFPESWNDNKIDNMIEKHMNLFNRIAHDYTGGRGEDRDDAFYTTVENMEKLKKMKVIEDYEVEEEEE